jgi:hypothetical protein
MTAAMAHNETMHKNDDPTCRACGERATVAITPPEPFGSAWYACDKHVPRYFPRATTFTEYHDRVRPL